MEEKNIIERFADSGLFVKEGAIDPDNFMFNGVCLFGRRESDNNRVYSSKAIASLARLAEGTKCYINHIGKEEIKNSGGVRDLRDWAGVFESTYDKGDAVFGNLRVREQYFDLMKDIAVMQPRGVGHSIDARVQMTSDEQGKESVSDVVKLRSVDVVSSAATTSNLWESIGKKIEENLKTRFIVVPEAVDHNVELLFRQEGIIQDQLDNDDVRRAISDISYTANRLIEDVIYNKEIGIADKKKKVVAIFDDLGKEVKKKLATIKKGIEEGKMEKLTLESLKAEHGGIVAALLEEFKLGNETGQVKTDLTEAQGKITSLEKEKETLESKIAEQDKAIKKLEGELQETKTKLDEKELAEKVIEKKQKINELITEAKLPKEAVSEIFVANLMAIEEYKDGEKVVTVEEQAKAMLKDRQDLINTKSGRVTGSGDEFVGSKKIDDATEEVTEADVDDFSKKMKK